MLKTAIKKEILEALLSFRFAIATLLCVVLIPLGMYVNMKEYQQRYADYQEAVALYQKRSEGNIHEDFQAWGYRPPSVMSIFSVGLEYFLPNKIVTSRGGNIDATNEQAINNPQSLLFGKVDLLFNVSLVMSLLALIFTFSVITGEKEDGTLRMIMSNSVPRWQILLAKLVGNYLVLLVPFILSILASLILLASSGIIPVFSQKVLGPFAVVLIAALLFILSMFTLGLIVTCLTHRSSTSIVLLLFVWTILVLSLPKISPMISEILYPVESQQVFNLRRSLVAETLEKELDQKRRELYSKIRAEFGLNPNATGNVGRNEEETRRVVESNARYDEMKKPLEKEYRDRMSAEIDKLQQNYSNRRNSQAAIATNISRISPVSCFTYVVSEMSATGIHETDNVLENARRFQTEVKENIYDKFIVKRYGAVSGGSSWSTSCAEGFDPRKAPVPQLSYKFHTLTDALSVEWVDIFLLFFFNIVFFALAHVSFNRYDVR